MEGIIRDQARALQESSTGKLSTQSKNLDTALPTIRPTPVLLEEHHDISDEEDHGQREATVKAKPTLVGQDS